MTVLSDSLERPVNYLRISVTDRCNLRCVYCMPPEGIQLMSHHEILSYEEIAMVARAAAESGVTRFRLTGGEPLVRSGLTTLVALLAQIDGVDDIALTTNGMLLEKYALELGEAGLRRVNISLDTLRSDRFHKITRIGGLEEVLRGMEVAREAGLNPIKTNTVVMRGVNDDEVIDFARLSTEREWHVRFIEYMPFSNKGKEDGLLVPVSEMRQHIETLGKLEAYSSNGGGPAKYFRIQGAPGTIGFISPVTEHFCRACNRMRLTADGKLRPCLFSDEEIDLKVPLRQGATIDDLKLLIKRAVSCKPAGHGLRAGITCERLMSQIGG